MTWTDPTRTAATADGLPDPDFAAGFYSDVAPKRLLAWVVDTLIVFFATLLVVVLTVFIGAFFFPVLFLGINFLYRWVTLARGSATWGMRLASIEFRTLQGDRLDLATAFFHTLGYSLSLSFVFPQIISVVLMLTTARGQGLSDLILGTAAINRTARY
ncbi:RDD family protein [Acidimangrovimonas sediminis]|uniref:RDD family protein n=1 Tax=Acidimangrovimonas sediminis TaxID=2056283 RepID=UPI000C7F8A79|nr:RDD family protein [Acidimangrovimonas sediminis]